MRRTFLKSVALTFEHAGLVRLIQTLFVLGFLALGLIVANGWRRFEMWKDYGITPDKTISFYCGTGWRSSLGFFYAYLMGWPNVKNYDGSWYEWSLGAGSDKRAKETGRPF